MNKLFMKKLVRFIPLILFLVLAAFLMRGLSLDPSKMPSALEGKKLPEFNLPDLFDTKKIHTKKDLKGDIILLNVWATWCPTCRYEHPYLLELAKSKRLSIYGLNYKDESALAKRWLKELKNPYKQVIFDEKGKLGLELGVYGAPETFIMDKNRVIRKRFAGEINPRTWQEELLPVILKIEAEIKANKASK